MLEVTLRDLFQSRATPEEIATFVADREPNALESLANRLAQRPGLKPFSGSLQSGPTRFRVIAPDSGSGQPAEKPAATPPAASSPPEEKPKPRVEHVEVGISKDPLFADDFNNGLSSKWQVVGLQKEDYRIRDGGLELRVQPGKRTGDTPMLKVILPFVTTSTVIASVDVTILDEFTEDGEFGGLCLIADDDVEFTVRKQRVNGSLVFAPGKYDFIGKPGDEGEPRQYTIKYWPALDESGPLRIIVRQKYAHFQVGPSSEDKFLNFFFSAIVDSDKKCGFSLVAAGGPKDAVHWVRFDNFRVTR